MFLLIYFGHPTLHGAAFQHDNAKPYAARHATQFLRQKKTATTTSKSSPGLPCTPDLSPIEHIWNELDRRVES